MNNACYHCGCMVGHLATCPELNKMAAPSGMWRTEYTAPRATKCPVCYGMGTVPPGFYEGKHDQYATSNVPPPTCRSCGGKGYVVV